MKLIEQVSADAVGKFTFAVYPVYAFVETGDPELLGTCFAIEYRNRKFLVTAAHVIDNHKHAALALGTPFSNELVAIERLFHLVDPGDKPREDDPFDFAWHELTAEEARIIACIPEDNIENRRSHEGGTGLYMAMGFPVSKNKKISPDDRRARRLIPLMFRYTNLQADADEYFKKRGMSPETHIAIKRENRSINEDGKEENTIGPKGLSGGPLINTGLRLPFSSILPPKVGGMILEKDEKSQVIVALRLSVVLQHIDATIGRFSSL
ncbi:hypothetical protein [Herbaspirillum sp. RV1423]|uniref:hypothetical protein n=1 Tax=Herbaspirillum sp. RV1423 TaxID=1443993 RepID=UPI0012DF8FB1|nr:hypothetical protein [Herbaspirillum sp. RV1423]